MATVESKSFQSAHLPSPNFLREKQRRGDHPTICCDTFHCLSSMQLVAIDLGSAAVADEAKLIWITGAHPEDENTFEQPTKVRRFLCVFPETFRHPVRHVS